MKNPTTVSHFIHRGLLATIYQYQSNNFGFHILAEADARINWEPDVIFTFEGKRFFIEPVDGDTDLLTAKAAIDEAVSTIDWIRNAEEAECQHCGAIGRN